MWPENVSPFGVVADLPVEVADDDPVKEPASFDLGAVVEQFTGPRPGRTLGQTLTDCVVDFLDLDEELVPVLGGHVGRAPESEVAAGSQR